MKELLAKVEAEIAKRNIPEEEISQIITSSPSLSSRRIIAGYASVSIIDREGQKISIPALRESVKRFMAEDRYRAVNIFHSNAQVGRVLPEWTDINTGKIYRTEVDETGWHCVCEIRSDIELANKVWEEILKGNLRSFSISGTAKKKHEDREKGVPFTEIDEIDIFECTICLPGEEKVWTKDGLKRIEEITTDDFVYTHKGNWQKVTEVMSRIVDEDLVKITAEKGTLTATQNHPIRTLVFGGQHKGTKYQWINIGDLKVGDRISIHENKGRCLYCNSPLFYGSHQDHGEKTMYCSKSCRYKAPGNRLGKTIASGDPGTISQSRKTKGITKLINPKKTGGIRTPEGRMKNKLGTTSESFKKKCVIRAQKQWDDENFVRAQMKARGARQNKLEKDFEIFLESLHPGQWKFVGDGEVIIGRKSPDFININGQKKIIELFGDFWHKGQNPQDRIDLFKKFGYDTLVIWEGDFRKQKDNIEQQVIEFCGNKLSTITKIEKVHFSGKVYNLSVENDESYVTEFATVHNCSIPVNPMSMFKILWEGKEKITI